MILMKDDFLFWKKGDFDERFVPSQSWDTERGGFLRTLGSRYLDVHGT